MANHALPTTTSLYTDVLTNLKDRIDDSLKMLDSVNTSPTNVPTNSIRWNSTTTLWEKYNGSSWISLAASYAIKVLKSTNLVGGNGTTLLGSIPYQSGTDTTTLLAPNTTTTRKFLRQTGTGTNGAAPVWDTILASDIPVLDTSKITTGTLPVSRGGTGVTTSTGTGSVVLSESPTFTGTVTAPTFSGALTGTATNATTATNVSGGSINATSGTFSNTVTLNGGVLQVGSSVGIYKLFRYDGTISPDNTNFYPIYHQGNPQVNITGNAATATKLTNSSGDWISSGASANVVGMLSWKNYGNGHVIFDASNGTAPNGTAVNNTNSAVPWGPSYPSLMGWNGTQTYGLRVDSSRVADYASNSGSSIGYNQTWQDVTASRVSGTIYTNSTGKPIMLCVSSPYSGAAWTLSYNISGIVLVEAFRGGSGEGTFTIIVPNGGTYSVTCNYGYFGKWLELR